MSSAGPGTRTGALGRLLADAARLDRSQSDPLVAARNALGGVIPLIVAGALGHPLYGVQATIGALQSAFADRPGPYRLRALRMLATSLAAAVTAGLATGLGSDVAASAVLVAVCAFAAGQLAAAGPSAAQVGIAATVAALVLGHIPQPPLAAFYTGLLVLAGGVVQTGLAVAAWPLGRHGPERHALAGLYRELAALARTPPGTGVGPPLGSTLADVADTLGGSDHGPSVEAYRVLLDEAHRTRTQLLVLAAYAERLERKQLGAGRGLRAVLVGTARLLEEVATSLQEGRPFDELATRPARAAMERAAGATGRLRATATGRAALARIGTLSGTLRAVVETATTGAVEGRTTLAAAAGERGRLRLRDPLATVLANLDPRSAAFRHAVRLAVMVPLADVVTRLAGFERGYWVSLTILVVLRPNFGATFQRVLMRVIGTLAGLVLASVLAHYLFRAGPDNGLVALIVLVGLLLFLMRLAGAGNLGLSALCVSALVVVLLAVVGQPAHTTAIERGVATVVGGAIALAAALTWPLWERSQLPERLAELLDAYRAYQRVLIDPEATGRARTAARAAGRLARSNAEASVDRARAEPVAGRGTVELGSAVLAHSHRLVYALLAIDATRDAAAANRSVPEFAALMRASDAALAAFAAGLRAGTPPRDVPRMRPLAVALAAALTAGESALADALVEASERLVDSIEALDELLRDRLRPVTAY